MAVYVKRTVVVYVVTDLVALYMVPRLPRTTVIHHVLCVVLCVALMTFELRTGDVVNMIGEATPPLLPLIF